VDGITRKMKALLQCKKKAFPGQTEAERWKQVYQILFPDVEDVPDPCMSPLKALLSSLIKLGIAALEGSFLFNIVEGSILDSD
jgi:hypothetical protein